MLPLLLKFIGEQNPEKTFVKGSTYGNPISTPCLVKF